MLLCVVALLDFRNAGVDRYFAEGAFLRAFVLYFFQTDPNSNIPQSAMSYETLPTEAS